MLKSLYISNYALIDHLDISFDKGLNIITGETGSGKSIVLGALVLLMGERADTRTIRNPDRKTIVEAKFSNENPALTTLLEQNDIDIYPEECILRRELTVRGSSRAFINDTPVNLSLLRMVSEKLVDIHTQHENLLLTDPGFQITILDSLAGNSALLENYRNVFRLYRKAIKEYSEFRDNLKRNQAENEYNSYLLAQLDELNLSSGEQEQLEHERDIVANAAQIKQHLSEALGDLSRNQNNVLTLLAATASELDKLSDYIIDSKELLERLESARIELTDIGETLEEYDANLSASDTDLESIEQRLGEIYSLESRHKVSTDKELIQIREKLRSLVNDVENGDEKLSQLEEKAKAAKKRVVLAARELSDSRKSVAEIFANELKERAMPLGMANLRCEIRVSQAKPCESGMDNVEFLFAFNRNQPLMPVGKTASGGEIARVILAIKSILVDKMELPTIIFDEVDTGVSGEIARRMAELMMKISETTQIITITHIAAVAAHGNCHFKVYKEDTSDSTFTHIRLLDNSERVKELASIISGDPNDTEAIKTAEAMLRASAKKD